MRRSVLVVAVLSLLLLQAQGCITYSWYDALAKRTERTDVTPGPPEAVDKIAGISVVSSAGQPAIVVAVHRLSGKTDLLGAPLPATREAVTLEPVALEALPDSPVPVRSGTGDHYGPESRPEDAVATHLSLDYGVAPSGPRLSVDDLSQAILVSGLRSDVAIVLHLSLVPPGGRPTKAINEYASEPVCDLADERELLIPTPRASTMTTVEEDHPVGIAVFVLISPLAVALDVAFSPFELLGALGVLLWLSSAHHH